MASYASQNSSTNQDRSYNLIWLDRNMNTHPNQSKLRQLREIDPDVKSFTVGNECIDYIREQDDRRTASLIILIISGALSENVIPEIREYACIDSIFIFCTNLGAYEHLQYPKLRSICTETDELLNNIELYISKYNTTTDFSFFHSQQSITGSEPSTPSSDNSQTQCSFRNLKEDRACFLLYRQLHEFMITLKNSDTKQAKKEMLKHCSEQCQGKPKMQQRIEEFSDESLADNKRKAISWYTDNSFIHECTNTVLRKENIAQIYSYRYIIKLICQQLKELHKSFIDNYREQTGKKTLRLFRGQFLALEHIKFLSKNITNLISLNGFVSTTKDRQIAMEFINRRWQEGFEPVLFKIEVDMTTEHSIAFADVSMLSKYPEEEEVLLSIGTIFCVKSVDKIDYDDRLQIHEICLTLNQQNQVPITDYIQQTYANNVDSDDRAVLFGKLLFDMGEGEAAIKYFLEALEHLSDYENELRATYYNNIGVCYNDKGKTEEALQYYIEALEIYKNTDNKRGVGACQHNIASVYHACGSHQEALNWAEKALTTRHGNGIEKASTFNLLGCIHLARKHPEAALTYFEDALKLRLKYLGKTSKYHPDIGLSYHNLGRVYLHKNPFEARTYFSQAAEIYRHNYSQTHQLIIENNKYLIGTQ